MLRRDCKSSADCICTRSGGGGGEGERGEGGERRRERREGESERAYVFVSASTCVPQCRSKQQPWGQSLTPTLSEAGSLVVPHCVWQAGWPVGFWRSPVSASCLSIRALDCRITLWLCMGSREPNTGPHTYMICALPTRPSPRPLSAMKTSPSVL